jgi:hypothetical protein
VVEHQNSVPSTDAPGSADANTNGVSAHGFERLPRAYQVGLRLRALGADDELIAQCLEIPIDGVATLLAIGEQKLQNSEGEVIDEADVENTRERD